MDVLHRLVRVVARSFYEDKSVVIFDTIVRETMVPDDVLIDRMQIIIRDFNRNVAHLLKDRLIKCETKQQPRADGKIITRNFLYIDYKQFVDIVKYRIFKMRQSVEEMIKKEMESKGYICPQCKTVFGSLDVCRLLNHRTGSFECDICPDSELQTFDSLQQQQQQQQHQQQPIGQSAHKTGPHELHSRLMEQTRLIIELLKQADEISIPTFNAQLWLEQNSSKYSLLTPQDDQDKGPQLAIAGSGSSGPSAASVSVEITDELTLLNNNNASSTANVLPDWHRFSTVTGEAIRSTTDSSTSDLLNRTNSPLSTSATVAEEEAIAGYYSQINEEDQGQDQEHVVVIEEGPATKQVKLDITVPMVQVGGVDIPLDKITEEDKDRMTEDEYTKYYEIYMSAEQEQ